MRCDDDRVRLLTDDGRFGVAVTPSEEPRFFTLCLLFDGEVVGDGEPAIVWSDLRGLTRLTSRSEPELDPRTQLPAEIHTSILKDDELASECLPGLGESFDRWSIYAYRHGDLAVFVFALLNAKAAPQCRMVDFDQYSEVIEAANAYQDALARR